MEKPPRGSGREAMNRKARITLAREELVKELEKVTPILSEFLGRTLIASLQKADLLRCLEAEEPEFGDILPMENQ